MFWSVEVANEVAVDVRAMSRPELCDRLEALGRLRSQVEAAIAACTGAIEALGDRGADAETVLRSATKCSSRTAKRAARMAGVLADMPEVAARFAGGALNAEAVDLLVSAAEQTEPSLVDGDARLLAHVESRPSDLARRETTKWVARHQTNADREVKQQRQEAARRAVWFDADNGMVVLHAELDPIIGARLHKRLDRETDILWRHDGGRDGKPDEVRSPAQRGADVVARFLGVTRGGDPDLNHGPSFGGADTLVVVADIGVIDGTNCEGRCEIVDVGPVPTSVLRELSPNTVVRGAIFAGDGQPLWLGRKQRLASLDQRLVLAIRDGGCRYCGAKTWQCHAHHIDDFNSPAKGHTDIDTMELACSRDHTRIHNHPKHLPRAGLRHESEEPGATSRETNDGEPP